MEEIGVSAELLNQLRAQSSYELERLKILSLIKSQAMIVLFAEAKAVLAGGALTSVFSNQPINDFDIYFKSKEGFERVNNTMKIHNKVLFETSSAITYEYSITTRRITQTYKVQLIKFNFGEPDEIIKNFDFTICQAAYDFEMETFHFNGHFFKHLAQKKLVYNPNCLKPFSSLVRTKKFEQRGYTISKLELLKVAISISQVKLETYGDLIDAAVGVSTTSHGKFIKKIKNEKLEEVLIKPQHVYELIDQFELENYTTNAKKEVEEVPF